MDIINATIQADLSVSSVEEGLLRLNPKDLEKVFLLVADNYNFSFIWNLFSDELKDKKDINKLNFSISNIDTSPTLATDSWMLIDYGTNTMYYSEGA